MKTGLKNLSAFSMLTVLFFAAGIAKEEQKMKEPAKEKDMAIFHVNVEKREILSVAKNLKDNLKFKFHSVTTDQPIYWPEEEVFLKVVMPVRPNSHVEVTIQKKDAAPNDPGKFLLNSAGMFVGSVMSGKVRRMEPGEYRVNVKTADGKISDYTTFTVVEGALGAVSFGYDFEMITDAKDLEKKSGAWFMGNASGVGMRWGNGLNIKNELRYLNQPYSGDVTIKTKCYLPGCDGVDTGPEVTQTIADGRIEATLNVGGHSGPFGIEVITKNGNISHLFGQSGHVERQTMVISQGLGNNFSATLAPYENTMPVPGRGIYITKDSEADSPLRMVSPIADDSLEVTLEVRRDLENPKIVVCHPVADDEFRIDEIKVPSLLKNGNVINVKCCSPYSLIGVGGFEGKTYSEGWAIVFTPSSIEVEIEAPPSGTPNRPVPIAVKTLDRFSKKGVPLYGILEVFDNRVQSKSARDPLVSSLGSSVREFSNYLSSWRDMTGYDADRVEYAAEAMDAKRPSGILKLQQAPSPASAGIGRGSQSDQTAAAVEGPEVQEQVREGEKKVLYCGILHTDAEGKALMDVALPPQTGRCKIRFTAVDRYEYNEQTKDIDVKKSSYLEVSVMPLLVPGAIITARATIVHSGKDSVKLTIQGAGLDEKIVETFKSGVTEYEFNVAGRNYGKLELALTNSAGKILDRREVDLRNIGSCPVTFSDVVVSDGKVVKVPGGRKVAVFSNPGMLLEGMAMDVVTSMYSWFGHVEALSSAAAIRALFLRAIDEKIIDSEGLRDNLKSDLVKTVKDLNEVFYNGEAKAFRPFPGMDTDVLWSLWTIKNLRMMANSLEGSKELAGEFASTLQTAKTMVDDTYKTLQKHRIDFEKETMYDFENDREVLPIEINGKVVYKLVTDSVVVDWFIGKIYKGLDMDPNKPIAKALVIDYDMYRFLRSLERTGETYYLVQNAKALYLQNHKDFVPLFNRIAKSVIQTQEPGVIKGPALLGGVYSSPLTISSFLDLLLTMAKDKRFEKSSVVVDGKKHPLDKGPVVLEAGKKDMVVKADPFTVLRIDQSKDVAMMDFLGGKPFFTAGIDGNRFRMGDEASMVVELDKECDPAGYYAIVAAPSTMSIKQTEDLLSDYQGQLLYGQREMGGEKIQLLAVPFRGSRRMVLKLGAAQKGSSEGYILVRHISNPDIIATVKLGEVVVE